MSRRVRVEIYAPAHFRATWKKFKEILERDGTTPSAELRTWIEGYVARKDPGNPQRPITAFVEGHDDELALRWSEILKELIARAERVGGEIRYRDVVMTIRAQGVTGPMIVARSESMCAALRAVGVLISY